MARKDMCYLEEQQVVNALNEELPFLILKVEELGKFLPRGRRRLKELVQAGKLACPGKKVEKWRVSNAAEAARMVQGGRRLEASPQRESGVGVTDQVQATTSTQAASNGMMRQHVRSSAPADWLALPRSSDEEAGERRLETNNEEREMCFGFWCPPSGLERFGPAGQVPQQGGVEGNSCTDRSDCGWQSAPPISSEMVKTGQRECLWMVKKEAGYPQPQSQPGS